MSEYTWKSSEKGSISSFVSKEFNKPLLIKKKKILIFFIPSSEKH